MSNLIKKNSPMQYQKEEKIKTSSSKHPLIQPDSTVPYHSSKHTATIWILLRDLSKHTGGTSNPFMKPIIQEWGHLQLLLPEQSALQCPAFPRDAYDAP